MSVSPADFQFLVDWVRQPPSSRFENVVNAYVSSTTGSTVEDVPETRQYYGAGALDYLPSFQRRFMFSPAHFQGLIGDFLWNTSGPVDSLIQLAISLGPPVSPAVAVQLWFLQGPHSGRVIEVDGDHLTRVDFGPDMPANLLPVTFQEATGPLREDFLLELWPNQRRRPMSNWKAPKH